MTATEVYRAMADAVANSGLSRKSEDPTSPAQEVMLEAPFGCTYDMDPRFNVVRCRRINVRWAAAGVLHFFADTEEAGMLRRYNDHADRFLTGDRWEGAYGTLGMPGIRRCVQKLKENRYSRRAVVDMGGLGVETINSPPCWNLLHFLHQDSALHMFVYQRSLRLSVMPYDAALLGNIHRFVSHSCELRLGVTKWAVGSVHGTIRETQANSDGTTYSILFPASVLSDPQLCLRALSDPTELTQEEGRAFLE